MLLRNGARTLQIPTCSDLAREWKRRRRPNASAESSSTPACQSGNKTTPAARAWTVQLDDLREAFYCAFLPNTSMQVYK